MSREIRLPARLVGIVRGDKSTPETVAVPCGASPSTPPAPPAGEGGSRPEDTRERANLERTLAALERGVEAGRVHQQRALGEISQAAVEIAVAVAGHFLMRQVSAGEFPFEIMVRKALERLASDQPASVSLHPQDLALLQRRLSEQGSLQAGSRDLRWLPDPTLGRGDCRVDMVDRGILFEFERRLEQLRLMLRETADAGQEAPGG